MYIPFLGHKDKMNYLNISLIVRENIAVFLKILVLQISWK